MFISNLTQKYASVEYPKAWEIHDKLLNFKVNSREGPKKWQNSTACSVYDSMN